MNELGKKFILIVDDELKIRTLLSETLRAQHYYTMEASDGKEALRLFEQYEKNIDLVLLDVMMSGYDGWTVCRRIRAVSKVPVIMLTARSDEFDEEYGFECGADDYVTKPIKPSALVARISRRLAHQQSDEQQKVVQIGAVKIDKRSHKVHIQDDLIDLSPTEYSLLLYLAEHPNQVISRDQLLNNVWGHDYVGTVRTVDVHMARLRMKMLSESAMIQAVRGFGYQFETEKQ